MIRLIAWCFSSGCFTAISWSLERWGPGVVGPLPGMAQIRAEPDWAVVRVARLRAFVIASVELSDQIPTPKLVPNPQFDLTVEHFVMRVALVAEPGSNPLLKRIASLLLPAVLSTKGWLT
jgi:hypothetical protein